MCLLKSSLIVMKNFALKIFALLCNRSKDEAIINVAQNRTSLIRMTVKIINA